MTCQGVLCSEMAGCFRVWRRQGRWLALVAAMVAICACTGRNASQALEGFGSVHGQDNGARPAIKPLDTRLVSAHATNRISLPGFDDKQPAQGNHFVVLDVAVRNSDTEPRVFSEGQIVAANASRERTFSTPVNIFADGYLQLQVLPPSTGARGKIVYEVPDDTSGVLYWVPGGDTRRILLHPDVLAVAGSRLNQPPPATSPVALAPPSLAPAQPGVVQEADAGHAAPAPGTVAVTASTGGSRHPDATTRASDQAPQVGQGSVATPAATQSTRELSMRSEQARVLACTALVSRNDPGEKTRYLGFFKRECAAYALPSAWTPVRVATAAPARAPVATATATATATARASVAPALDSKHWPPRSGPAFDCEQAFSPGERLTCGDSVLSLMDWELTRAYANARRSVEDPAALQREQDDWRWHVRNACRTVSCVEAVYTERTADLSALARPQ